MDKIKELGNRYFSYMARNYPVMCLSDEFYFFPRASKSIKYPNSLDSLDPDKIKENTSHVKRFRRELLKLSKKDISLNDEIDHTLLLESMDTFIREFDHLAIWRIDPTIYFKIFLLGIDYTRTRLSSLLVHPKESLRSRLGQVPRLMKEAESNLKDIPIAYLETALDLCDVSIRYIKSLNNKVERKYAVIAIEEFKRFLKRKSGHRSFVKSKDLLVNTLKESFSYKRSLREIYEIAECEYHETIEELKETATLVNPRKNWQTILSEYKVPVKNRSELLSLYRDKIEKIKEFLIGHDIIEIPKTQKIITRRTPYFLSPVRASASYASPATNNLKEPAFFYVTEGTRFLNSIHSEYLFVTAHETFPGHHLLDAVRRNFKNPVRRQIESALFYEGWASYAESLIDELGFIRTAKERLPGLRRKAWRAGRAMLDVGLRTGKLTPVKASLLLTRLGYEKNQVSLMLRHYVLTPGYQLCYTMGKFEIDELKRKYCASLGLKRFHKTVLSSGEIPFHLLERKLKEGV